MDDVTEVGGGGHTQEPSASQATCPHMLHRCKGLFAVCPITGSPAGGRGVWLVHHYSQLSPKPRPERGSGQSARLWQE